MTKPDKNYTVTVRAPFWTSMTVAAPDGPAAIVAARAAFDAGDFDVGDPGTPDWHAANVELAPEPVPPNGWLYMCEYLCPSIGPIEGVRVREHKITRSPGDTGENDGPMLFSWMSAVRVDDDRIDAWARECWAASSEGRPLKRVEVVRL